MINSKYGIGWTTGSHTGNPVPLFAVGRDAMLLPRLSTIQKSRNSYSKLRE